jgi:pimeloyl-ACP methyl ester carboxylesterase
MTRPSNRFSAPNRRFRRLQFPAVGKAMRVAILAFARAALAALALLGAASTSLAQDGAAGGTRIDSGASGQPGGPVGEQLRETSRPLTVEHYVEHRSTVPAMAGEAAQLYVRERVLASTLARGSNLDERVVLFVHGAGTPAEVAFDVPYEDYSWMAYLAEAGYDVFSMDMTGYGRSTRPYAMNDPCNLSPEQRSVVIGGGGGEDAACAADGTHPGELTTIASDWDDLDAVVEHIRRLRRVERVAMIGWSLGGPRAGGYAARYPDKVSRLVLLAPAYARDVGSEPAPAARREGAAMTIQSHADFAANWDRQVGCANQYDPGAGAVVWAEMLASDPVGATWGPGVRRAPRTSVWGWNEAAVRGTETPTLLVAAAHDRQILPQRVRDLYDDLGTVDKVLIDLGCASHNAMWERVHTELFRASLEWLRDGRVGGLQRGVLRLAY